MTETAGFDEEKLMFGGMARVVNALLTDTDMDDATIKITCEKEVELYLKTPGIPLRNEDHTFTDPLQWWAEMEVCGKFPILQEVAKPFLVCPATLAPSERIWARSGGVVTNMRIKLKNAVTSASIFVSEN